MVANGWKNKKGTAERACSCGTWKKHWIKFSGKAWPRDCSVSSCIRSPSLAAHVHNPSISGEKIVPMCNSCNALQGIFILSKDATLVNACKSETCDK